MHIVIYISHHLVHIVVYIAHQLLHSVVDIFYQLLHRVVNPFKSQVTQTVSTSGSPIYHPVDANVNVPVYAASRVLVIQTVQTFVTVLFTQSIVRVHLEVVVGHPHVHVSDCRVEVMWKAERGKTMYNLRCHNNVDNFELLDHCIIQCWVEESTRLALQ